MEYGSAGKRNCLLWYSLGSRQGSPTQIGRPRDTIVLTVLGSKVAPVALGWELRAAVVLPYEAHLHTCSAPLALCPAQISDNPNVYLGTNLVWNSLSLDKTFLRFTWNKSPLQALKVSKCHFYFSACLAFCSLLSFLNGPGWLPVFALCMNPRLIVWVGAGSAWVFL